MDNNELNEYEQEKKRKERAAEEFHKKSISIDMPVMKFFSASLSTLFYTHSLLIQIYTI